MDRLSFAILKAHRLGINVCLKDSANNFEKMHYLNYVNEKRMLSWSKNAEHLTELIKRNRPLSQIIKTHPFLNCSIKVTNGLLVPRPETEEFVHFLIQKILNHRKNSFNTLRILDIGSGTGCIAIGLAANLENVHVTAIDIDPLAYSCTKNNVSHNQGLIYSNKSEVSVIHANIFDDTKLKEFDKFDMIISNPPYIPTWKRKTVEKSVLLYECRNALFPCTNIHNGLLFHKRILKLSQELLLNRPSTELPKIVLEFDGAYQIPSFKKLLQDFSFDRFYFRRDPFNRFRTLWIH